MANKHRGYVDIELDQPRKLKFNTNAIAELEDALGKPFSQIFPQQPGATKEEMAALYSKTIGIRELRALLWAGLLHESPNLTLQGAGDLLEFDNLTEITQKVMHAVMLMTSKGKDQEKNGASGPAEETGGET